MDKSLKARINMVDSQIRPNDVTNPAIVRAFSTVPREAFVGKAAAPLAYSELEIETSPGRALWTPRDFAKLLAAAKPAETDLALVIGCGAGYECAILNGLVDTVIGIDEDESVVNATGERLAEEGFDHVAVVPAKLADGLPEEGPYDLVMVLGMVEQVPEAWTAQLKSGGRVAVVVDTGKVGKARIYTRTGDAVSFRDCFDATPPKFNEFNAPETFAF